MDNQIRKQLASPPFLLGKLAILIFGAIPALLPADLALIGFGPISYLIVGAPYLVLLLLCPLAGLYGVTSLWLAAFGHTSRTVAVGLIAEIFAILPLRATLVRQSSAFGQQWKVS